LHLGCLAVFFVDLNPTAIGLCITAYWLRMFGITAGYHRYFAHHAFTTSRVGQFLLACLGCSAMQKGPLWWTANHRQHHRHSDQAKDPHSPQVDSFWWSHIGWVLSEEHQVTDWDLVKDWSRFPELRWLNRWHWTPGLGLAGICWLLGGVSGFVWGFVVSTVLLYHATFLVNSVCHLLGSRRYETPDQSRNNLIVALLTCGEGWHNNHHHYPVAANQGFRWWEVDASYYALRCLAWIGLVWNLRAPPRSRIEVSAPPAAHDFAAAFLYAPTHTAVAAAPVRVE
jgi:stearoyl-CoA desaturase (Delta-9 desaturase)